MKIVNILLKIQSTLTKTSPRKVLTEKQILTDRDLNQRNNAPYENYSSLEE